MEATLTISHNLYLTKEQRYAWYNGEDVEIVGVSLPVCDYNGATSEPGAEVFVKYTLLNRPERIFIQQRKDGYEIMVPKSPPEVKKLPDEVWNSLSHEDQEIWYKNNEPSPTILNLLDVKDGGSQWLAFRQYSKIKKNRKFIHLIHFVEIKPMEDLLQTLA